MKGNFTLCAFLISERVVDAVRKTIFNHGGDTPVKCATLSLREFHGARSAEREAQKSEVRGQRTGKKLKAESSKLKGKERRTEDGEGQRSEVRGPEGGRGGKIRRCKDRLG